jgi:hypothetical protein
MGEFEASITGAGPSFQLSRGLYNPDLEKSPSPNPRPKQAFHLLSKGHRQEDLSFFRQILFYNQSLFLQ